MAISLDEANAAVAAAIAKAKEMNIKINVAVVDAGARLLAFNRMDGAIWAGMYGCQGKAVGSAMFGMKSATLGKMADTPIAQGIFAAEGGHAIPAQGAVPIYRNGACQGAIGVGGGTGQQDEDCAAAGMEKIGGKSKL